MKNKFYLRKGGKPIIHFEARLGTQFKYRVSLGIILNNLKDWDQSKQRVKLPSSTPQALVINQRLATIETRVGMILIEHDNTEARIDKIQAMFTESKSTKLSTSRLPKTKKNEEYDLIAYFEFFMKHYKTQPSPYSKKILSPATFRTFGNILSILKRYMVDRSLTSIPFSSIDRNFHADLIDFLMQKKYAKNYIGSVIQKVKTILQYAFDEGKHTNVEFQRRYFSKMAEVVHHPYLDLEELERIYNVQLNNGQEALARDIFLIGCYSGLRVGDLTRFLKDPDFVTEDGVLLMRIRQSKTSAYVFIPVGSRIRRIMDRYYGKMPDYLHPSIINKHLKSIAKKAKITEEYQYFRTEGSESVVHKAPKYKFITTHTARRSFCTNAYTENVPIQDIMAISGHKTERVFMDYIKVESVKNAARISGNAFFK